MAAQAELAPGRRDKGSPRRGGPGRWAGTSVGPFRGRARGGSPAGHGAPPQALAGPFSVRPSGDPRGRPPGLGRTPRIMPIATGPPPARFPPSEASESQNGPQVGEGPWPGPPTDATLALAAWQPGPRSFALRRGKSIAPADSDSPAGAWPSSWDSISRGTPSPLRQRQAGPRQQAQAQ